jgi:hypothetical protein
VRDKREIAENTNRCAFQSVVKREQHLVELEVKYASINWVFYAFDHDNQHNLG